MTLKLRPLSDEGLELVARRFRLLGDPVRLRLLRLLDVDEKNVTELTAATGLAQPTVSKQLRALLDGGLVARRAEGNVARYRVADPLVHRLCELVCQALEEKARGEAKELGGRSN